MTAAKTEPTEGHEHEDRTVRLLVNTRPHPWARRPSPTRRCVELAYPGQPVSDGEEVTVRYTRGHDDSLEGSLTAGHSVKVKNKMVFDVYRTSRS